MKKCPPGVICVENISLFFIISVICIVYYVVYFNNKQNITITQNERIVVNPNDIPNRQSNLFGLMPNYPYNNLPQNMGMPKDVLLDPREPPYRDERYFMPKAVPINVSTNVGAVDTSYRQMGILTPLNSNSKDNILSLMGRPLFTSRQKFQYYTISNQHNNVKLPVSVKGKSALSEYGVDELYNGDTVYVEGYNDAFKVTKYENDTIKYLPFL
jgi:hypothetical protein